jgi:crossover junction endodeoxyribonuclease RuvC
MRLIGLDPGLQRTGWGVIQARGNVLGFLAAGVVATDPRQSLALRLDALYRGLAQVIGAHAPDVAAIEETVVNVNGASSLKLGQARGVALLVPGLAGVSVAEYAPNVVKKSIVGAGHGDKAQVRMMIGVLLPRADPASEDAADALAVAVTHAHHRQSVMVKAAAR